MFLGNSSGNGAWPATILDLIRTRKNERFRLPIAKCSFHVLLTLEKYSLSPNRVGVVSNDSLPLCPKDPQWASVVGGSHDSLLSTICRLTFSFRTSDTNATRLYGPFRRISRMTISFACFTVAIILFLSRSLLLFSLTLFHSIIYKPFAVRTIRLSWESLCLYIHYIYSFHLIDFWLALLHILFFVLAALKRRRKDRGRCWYCCWTFGVAKTLVFDTWFIMPFLKRECYQRESWADFHKKYHSNVFRFSASNHKVLQPQYRRRSMEMAVTQNPSYFSRALLDSSSSHQRKKSEGDNPRRINTLHDSTSWVRSAAIQE